MTAVAAISQQIWDMKYRLKMLDGQPVDKTVGDTWTRVAKALAEDGAATLNACDGVATLTGSGQVQSLNVAATAAILIHELTRAGKPRQ